MKSMHRSTRRYHRTLLACALAGCMLAAAPQVLAQSTAATIRGQVSIDSAPASEASVTATNTATGLTRTVQVSNGTYSVAGLPPGTYRVDVNAGGQTNSRTVTVQVAQVATLDLMVGGVAETVGPTDATDLDTVTVTASALVETKTSEVGSYVTNKQITALPQGTRNFLAFADIVPGIKFSTGNDGSTSLKSGAQSSAAVNVFIDGVGQKDYVLKGGVTGQDSSRGNPFPQLGIAEYKVITSNYKAEYDQLSSAGITAVTKSGTNEFHGDFFWDQTNDGWQSKTPRQVKGEPQPSSKEEQYGVSLGGPIIPDRMHFFVAYEAKEYNSPRAVTPGRNFTIEDIPPQFRDEATQTIVAPFKEDLYFGKIDWTPGDDHLIELTFKRREEDELTNVGNGANTASYGTLKTGEETRIDLRYQLSRQDWLNDAHITYEDANFAPRPYSPNLNGYKLQVPREGQEGNNNPDMELVLNLGGGGDYQNKGQKGYSFQDDFTYFGFDRHTIKAGIKYKKIDISAYEQSPYSPQFDYDVYQDLDIPYHVEFTASGNNNATSAKSNSKQFGFYIQDDWDVTDKLQLNLGLRWDYETTPSYEDQVTPDTLVEALRNYTNIQNDNAGYDINDYISTGSERKAFKDAYQPRLGFSYDLMGDERHVIFGGAGRSYNRNQFDYMSYEIYRLAFQRYSFYFNTPGHDCTAEPVRTPCIDFDPSYFDRDALADLIVPGENFGSEVFLINNDLKTPYSDQFSLGMRNSFPMLGHDWNSSVTLLHVMSHDGISVAIGNRRADGTFWPPGVTFGSAPGADLPGYSRFFLMDNGAETRLNSLLLSLDKPYSKDSPWGVSLAYTYSEAKDNRGSDIFENVFDYPNLDETRFIGTVGIPRHRFVGTGIVDFWGMTASAKLTLESAPGNRGTDCYDGFDPGGCDNAIRRTYYFNDQDFRQLDVALQKEWDTGGGIKLRVRGDVLNVTNERNYSDFGNFRGVDKTQNDQFGRRTTDNILLPTRTFKLSFGLNW
ncbi:MAG TPA: TonB-dependent receptor [Luteimonas sp.]|nr:TonB-dependent receptor [Luteimonas sp.]